MIKRFITYPTVLIFSVSLFFSFSAESSVEDNISLRLSAYLSLEKEAAQHYKSAFAQAPNCESPSTDEIKSLLLKMNEENNVYGKSSLDDIAKQISWNKIEFLEKEKALLQRQGDQLGSQLQGWHDNLHWHHFYYWITHPSCSGILNYFFATEGSLNNLFTASQNLVASDCIKDNTETKIETKNIESSTAKQIDNLTNLLEALEPRLRQCVIEAK